MKFDLNRAWTDALGLVSANSSVVAIVAGVFFFLPYLALMLFAPQMFAGIEAQAQTQDPQAMMDAMMGVYAQYWWVFVLMLLIQTIGMIALIALLGDRARPTVGDAIVSAIKLLPSYIGASLLTALAFMVVVAVVTAIGAATGSHVILTLLGVAAFILLIYAYVKVMLFIPVLALEHTYNPVTALVRSWRLTRGNAFRLFLFYFLLLIAFVIVSAIIGMVFGLAFGLMGSEVAIVGNALVGAAVNSVFVVLFLAVLAATYRQLAAERVSVPATAHDMDTPDDGDRRL
ncbi:hypothetical protein F7D01_04605 [Erythrobacter sp. 3-20A1M]|uniref:glycerophosphoryl diester phosphodiesterase membrane domain-containing protein n=1 Tax=Erythrobacter sp. 3-20A1M TaxID=2653850 RepID=UPI001BFCBA9D|nr:glycerophosphoryl diester phosphodiesterase membrane domain-containing protein [Erythrobacter sp. 3-20A1M]QWC56469.1 hypothetical protein F7D01_04605 [Erythrobacter sp. 3-20A1M]